jgi:hypothetical protein
VNYSPGVASNCDPPDLIFPSKLARITGVSASVFCLFLRWSLVMLHRLISHS